MPLEFGHGAIQWLAADAIGITYAVTGLPFEPKALRFYCVGVASATNLASSAASLRNSVGFAVSPSQRRCVAQFSEDGNVAGSNCGSVARDDAVVCTTDGAGGGGENDFIGYLAFGNTPPPALTALMGQAQT